MGAAAVISGIGMGLQAIGMGVSASKEKKQAEQQKKVYTLDALAAAQAGQYKEQVTRESGERFLREQAAEIGASGANVKTGSALDIAVTSAENLERDIRAIKMQTEHEVMRNLTAAGYDPKVLKKMGGNYGSTIEEFRSLYGQARGGFLGSLMTSMYSKNAFKSGA